MDPRRFAVTSTLGKLIVGRYSVSAYCERCKHSREIDLEAMAVELGAEARVQGSADIGPARIGGRALRCGVSACRSYNTSIRISPVTPTGPMAR